MPDFAAMVDRRFSGTRVRALRIEAGLTQTELALMSGVSPRAIAYIEAGERMPNGMTIKRLARGFGAKVAAFYVVAQDEDHEEAS